MSEKTPFDYKNAVQLCGKDIYSPIEVGDPHLWIPTTHLEFLLNHGLVGCNLFGLPLRTRSKIVKIAVCNALGYPVPQAFRKSQPRFFGQQLDIYAQKSNNLQIWNEELSPTRRYALIKISEHDVVLSVKVVNGQQLALLDTTGKITTKYQALLTIGASDRELISNEDTRPMLSYIRPGVIFPTSVSPAYEPEINELLPIQEIFIRLQSLIGQSFSDPGMVQERNRGAALHRLVCQCLGYSHYEDKGQFPDIRHQLLEIKLQTSPTIDLGLVSPISTDLLDIQKLGTHHPRHCDTRYAIFFANTNGTTVTITHLFVTTGADFFYRFRQFGGQGINGKIQIPLPRNFFNV